MKANIVVRYLLLIGLEWTLICAVALSLHLQQDRLESQRQVLARAEAMLERDLLYRDWVASHGGVYVPVSESSPPNPHMEFLPGRDVKTADGRLLTLVNPSYMTHMAFAMDNRLGKTVSKITSLKYLNPANAPDEWEAAALRQFEQGVDRVSAVASTGNGEMVRAMRAFRVDEACLKCHETQGYKVGDVRGGLSISIPLESVLSAHASHRLLSVGLFVLLWAAGTLSLYLIGRRLYYQTQRVVESERQRVQVEEDLSFVSNYDRRSRLPNRFKFEEELAELFTEVGRQGDEVAVAVLEIRNYRQIVDNFDHPVGDLLFNRVADRLTGLLEGEGAAARFGEDRLLFSCRGPADRFGEGGLLQKVLTELGRPLILEGLEFYPVVCLGAAFYPDDGIEAELVVRRAVSAMTSILDNRQGGLRLYCDSLQTEARSRLEIERGLRQALAGNAFDLHYQPQIDALSGELVGAEALLRWQQEDGSYIPPAVFIPVAEEQGLILPIGEWVLLTACSRAAQLKRTYGRDITIAVNVSARQFQDPNFIDFIDQALAVEGMSPGLLEIEITEGTFFENVDRTIEIIVDLKSRGIQIAIDDFGTGFSSLSYLKRFPLDCLKIDRSFVEDIATSEDDRVLVGLIAEMARKMDLRVIAEGVETEMQKHLLLGMQCHVMQGFLFSRPLAFDDFCRYLEGPPSA